MRHLRVLRERLGVETVALPARAERADDVRLSPYRTVRSYEEARDLGVTAVIVATDTGRHLSDVESALDVGCHVLVEKPISPTIEGLARLASHCSNIRVGHNMRFLKSLHAFRDRLPEVGTIRYVRIECQSFLPDWRPDADYRRSYSARAHEGGVLRDLVHEIDYACWLFGRPDEVSAVTKTGRLGIEADEEADLFWMSGPSSVSIRLDYISRVARRVMHAYGDTGDLEWDGLSAQVILRKPGCAHETTTHPMDRDESMAEQTRAFLDILDGGNGGGVATLDDGAFAVAVCDAARASSAQKQPRRVPRWQDF